MDKNLRERLELENAYVCELNYNKVDIKFTSKPKIFIFVIRSVYNFSLKKNDKFLKISFAINRITTCDFPKYFPVQLHSLRIYYTRVNWFMNLK